MELINNFNSISISGRYIYGYLCLLNSIKNKQEEKLPNELDVLLKEFVESNELDGWHEKIEEVLPSVIMQKDYEIGYYEVIDSSFYDVLKEYYEKLSDETLKIIDDLFTIGFSNLYGEFDSSESMEYLKNIIDLMSENNLKLPDFNIVENCSVTQRNGWGDLTKLDDYLINYNS
ncbi:hypothetical protein PG911_10435 [Tenacibaculum ovolyticum]|uniref:hypothetical protein n=1 Tax=Tenacibaculum ovolyticum TaxID=104270 RepID=UPI0022F3B476|nr:hypothetical protein [Tenacibaculum ovolyticum]WBX75074.1 hypothetical protein PG911_10435 [Tenacibaculum ovolyticum]